VRGCKESSEKGLGHNRRVTNNPGLPEYEREIAKRNPAVSYNVKLLIIAQACTQTCAVPELKSMGLPK